MAGNVRAVKRPLGKTVSVKRVWMTTKEFMKYTGMGRDGINEMRANGLVKVAVVNSRRVFWNVQSFDESMERATVNETVYNMQQAHLNNVKRRNA